MPEVTNELMYEVLKELRNGVSDMKAQLYGIREEISAVRTHMAATQSDVNNLYISHVDMTKDLETVKRRLNLGEQPQ